MKNKMSVPNKSKLVKPVQARPPDPPTTQWVEQSCAAERCRGLETIDDIMRFFQSPGPSVIDCEDVGYRAYQIAAALTELHGAAAAGLEAEGSGFPKDVAQYACDGIRMQLQIARLAAKTLFELCHRGLEPKTQAPSNAS
jgi:hypothetical protein